MAETKKGRAAILDQSDVGSASWLKVKKYTEARIALLRARNDSGKLDERKTALLRGRIAELKNLATLDQPAPQTEADDDLFD